MMNLQQQQDYKTRSNGRFSGVLRWPQFEIVWEAMKGRADGWYVYAPDEGEPPLQPLTAEQMNAFLQKTETYLRERCTPDFCGAVYTDSVEAPDFVKVYNPRLMGGCSMGKAPLPQWLISRMAPVSFNE